VGVDWPIVVGKDAEATADNPAGGGRAVGGNDHHGHAWLHIEIVAPVGMSSGGQLVGSQRLFGRADRRGAGTLAAGGGTSGTRPAVTGVAGAG
jgi:hypothetical protein